LASPPKSFCTIVGGPNGSGKSTIFGLLNLVGQFINADIVARTINPNSPEAASLAAGRVILRQLKKVTAARENFSYETTLSSNQSLALMSKCRQLGYDVALVFVTLDDPDLNVRRVAERVAGGGHDIPEDVIRRRYDSSLIKLPRAIRLADSVLIFDNSGFEPEMLLSIERGKITKNRLNEASAFHVKLASAVAIGIGTGPSSVFDLKNS
jgi:predicted ABC-type ATPase